MSGFNVILPTLLVKLDIPQTGAVWPAAAFALVTAAFLLPFGASLTNMAPTQFSSLDWCGSAFGPSLSDFRPTNSCWIFAGHFKA